MHHEDGRKRQLNYEDLKKKERLTYEEAAHYCGRSIRTMKRWVNRGWLQAVRITLGSVFVLRSSIDRLCEELAARDAARGSQDAPVTAKDLRLSRA